MSPATWRDGKGILRENIDETFVTLATDGKIKENKTWILKQINICAHLLDSTKNT